MNKEIKSRELLKEWQSLIVDDKAIIKAVEWKEKRNKEFTAALIVTAEETAKYIANLLGETTKELDTPFYLSPYNPAHGNYTNGNCCGIFNALNDDLEVVCNECDMKLTALIDDIYSEPIDNMDEYILIKFQKMCEESLSPEQFEMFKTVEKQLLIVRKNLK